MQTRSKDSALFYMSLTHQSTALGHRHVFVRCGQVCTLAHTILTFLQADCVMVVGMGDDPSIGEYERLLLSMKTTARKELVLLHPDRSVVPGSTREWLKVCQSTLQTLSSFSLLRHRTGRGLINTSILNYR